MENYIKQGKTGIINGIKVKCYKVTGALYDRAGKTGESICEASDCFFYKNASCNLVFCLKEERKDNMDVYFKKVE